MQQARLKLLLREAITSLRSGNKEWARECLTRILKADPRHEEAWLWLSAVLETPAEKRYCLEKVLTINPDNEQARAGLRELAARESGYRPPKRTICPMCGEPNPPTAFQCANCGQDLFIQCPSCGERVDIERPACAQCGLEIGDSSDGAAYFFHLGELYLQHGKPKQALAAWDKTLILEPDFPGIAEAAAEAFLASGSRELALKSFSRALEEATEPAHRRKLRLRLAAAYRDWGELEEAVRLCQEILREDQESRTPQADVYAELGRLYEKMGDQELAREHYEMALVVDEHLDEVRLAMADLLLAQGYEYRALSEYRALQSVEGPIGQQAAERIRTLRPSVPEEFRNRWRETARGVAAWLLAGLLLLVLRYGSNWSFVSPYALSGIFAFLAGGYFLTAATRTPRNLPTFAQLAVLMENPALVRVHRWSWRARQSSALQHFMAWQRRATGQLLTNLHLFQARFRQRLQAVVASLLRIWQRVRHSRLALLVASLPRSRSVRAVADFFGRPFFRSLGNRIGRLLPRRTQTRTERLEAALRQAQEKLRARTELSELDLYRWMAGILGVLLLLLAGTLVLFW